MIGLLERILPSKRQRMQWCSSVNTIVGRAWECPAGQWQLVGKRTYRDALGNILQREHTSVQLFVGLIIEVLGDDGTWLKGRVEYKRGERYVLRRLNQREYETLDSLAKRDARLRLVQP